MSVQDWVGQTGVVDGVIQQINQAAVHRAAINSAPVDVLDDVLVGVTRYAEVYDAGQYLVRVHNLDAVSSAPGQRVWDILVNGLTYVRDLDPYQITEQASTEVVRDIVVAHPGGLLTVDFIATAGVTSIAALGVWPGSHLPLSVPLPDANAKTISNVQLSTQVGGERIDMTVNFPVLSYGWGDDSLPASDFDINSHWEWDVDLYGPVDPAKRTFDLTALPADEDIHVFFRPLDGSALVEATIHTLGAVDVDPELTGLWTSTFTATNGTVPSGVTAASAGGSGTSSNVQGNQYVLHVNGRSGQDDYAAAYLTEWSVADGYIDFEMDYESLGMREALVFLRSNGTYPTMTGLGFGLQNNPATPFAGTLDRLVIGWRDGSSWTPLVTKPWTTYQGGVAQPAGTRLYGRFQTIGTDLWGYLGIAPFGNRQWNASDPSMVQASAASIVSTAAVTQFTGSNGSAWPSPWRTYLDNLGASASQQGGWGRLRVIGPNDGSDNAFAAADNPVNLANVRVTGKFRTGANLPGSLSVWMRHYGDFPAPSGGVAASIEDNGTTLRLQKRINGVWSQLSATTVAVAASTAYNFVAETINNTVRWWHGTGTWDGVTYLASQTFTGVDAAGAITLFNHIGKGVTLDVEWDDIQVIPLPISGPGLVATQPGRGVLFHGEHGYVADVDLTFDNVAFTQVVVTSNKALSNPVKSSATNGQILTFDFNFEGISYGRGDPAAPDWEFNPAVDGAWNPAWRQRSLTALPDDTLIPVFVRPADGSAVVTAVYRTGITSGGGGGGGGTVGTGLMQIGHFNYDSVTALQEFSNNIGHQVMHGSTYAKPISDPYGPAGTNSYSGRGFGPWLGADRRRTMTQGFNFAIAEMNAWDNTAADAGILSILQNECLGSGVLASQMYVMFMEEQNGATWAASYDPSPGHAKFKSTFARWSSAVRGLNPDFKIVCCVTVDQPYRWTSGEVTDYLPALNSFDVLAVDVYDWFQGAGGDPDTGLNGPRWTNTKGILQGLVNWCSANGKRPAVNEMGLVAGWSRQGGGDDPFWLIQFFEFCATHNFAYLTYFDTPAGSVETRLAENPNSVAALRTWLDAHLAIVQ